MEGTTIGRARERFGSWEVTQYLSQPTFLRQSARCYSSAQHANDEEIGVGGRTERGGERWRKKIHQYTAWTNE